MRYIIKRISSRVGINNDFILTSYARHLLNNGAPIHVIQSLLGHENSETTRIYALLSGSLRREFYRKYFQIGWQKATDNSAAFSLLPPFV
ncbi:tyrosine-type recombinase/integrase [Neobacillus sp. GCM10023253]|uniref:tyrosine-type recombinase/integrase n=1 Tax=Neobacillus sp. GCM10023253 TaxID=3252644 RepID=UPI00361418FF